MSPPGAKMHFVDRERVTKMFAARTSLHPFRIAKPVFRFVDDRRSIRRSFRVLRVRIGLEYGQTSGRAYLKLVEHTRREFRNEQLPDPGLRQHPHLVRASVPTIEVANNTNGRGLRRPDSKSNAARAAQLRHVRAEFFVDLFVFAFAEEMEIEFAEYGWDLLADLFFHRSAGTSSAKRVKISAPLPFSGRLLMAAESN